MFLLGKVRMQRSNLIIGNKLDTTFYRRENGGIDFILEFILSMAICHNIERGKEILKFVEFR